MSDVSDFELSRAYAAGWNAAKQNYTDNPKWAKNPFPAGPKHDRWATGYAEALESDAG